MMERGDASGYLEISVDHDDGFDPGFDVEHSSLDFSPRVRRRGTHERVRIAMEVAPVWQTWDDALDPPTSSRPQPTDRQLLERSRAVVQAAMSEPIPSPPTRDEMLVRIDGAQPGTSLSTSSDIRGLQESPMSDTEVRRRYEEAMATPPNRLPPVSRDWEKICICLNGDPGACPLHRGLYQGLSPPPPRRDSGPALDVFIQIVKQIIAAWASDDRRRFALLELD